MGHKGTDKKVPEIGGLARGIRGFGNVLHNPATRVCYHSIGKVKFQIVIFRLLNSNSIVKSKVLKRKADTKRK